MTKSYFAPDIAQSIRSGVPLSHLAPDLARAIRSHHSAQWIAPDLAEDINAIGADDPSDTLPEAPFGTAYLVNGDGKYILNADGAYVLAKV